MLLEVVQNFLCGNFSSMIEVLVLQNIGASYSSPFSFLLIISTTKQNIDESQLSGRDQATNTGRVRSFGVSQPGRWRERTLPMTSVCCSPRGKTAGGTRTGVWPRIFDNFEVLKFYQVLLSNITMIFLGTGTTG